MLRSGLVRSCKPVTLVDVRSFIRSGCAFLVVFVFCLFFIAFSQVSFYNCGSMITKVPRRASVLYAKAKSILAYFPANDSSICSKCQQE